MKTVSNSYFDSVLDYLSKRGVSKSIALSAIKFDDYERQLHHDPKIRVPLTYYNELLNFASVALAEPLFGFYLGQDIRTADYGILGYLIESGENLDAAIKALTQYDVLVADIGRAEFSFNQQYAEISWTPVTGCNEQVILRNMTAWVAVIRQLVDKRLSPTKVCFEHHWPDDSKQQLSNWFNCPVEFNGKTNKVQFESALLNLPFRTENSTLHQLLEQQSAQELNGLFSQHEFHSKVADYLASKEDLQQCDLTAISEHFHISTRTFQRRLLAENKYFSELLDMERQQRTTQLLGKMPLGTIAMLLGFSGQSAFNRAFHRWYHCTPSNFIKAKLQLRQES